MGQSLSEILLRGGVGAVLLLAAIGMLGTQIYWFLLNGTWTPMSVIDLGIMLFKWPWGQNPTEWIGLHKVLDFISSPLAFFTLGLLVFGTK